MEPETVQLVPLKELMRMVTPTGSVSLKADLKEPENVSKVR